MLTAPVRGRPRVVQANAAAARAGVAPGMALAAAEALAAGLRHAPWDEDGLARAALEVTGALLAASPRVAWERGLGAWWVDAAGLGSEARLAVRLRDLAAAAGFGPVRVGVADSAVAAYAASCGGARHAGAQAGRARGVILVAPGHDAVFLAPFPLELLDLDDDLALTLRALGLDTVGRLAALESDEVDARFGAVALDAHRLARGIDPRGPVAPRDGGLPRIACDLGAPVATVEPLLFVLRGALASLGTALRERGLAAREIVLTLTLDDGSSVERAVRPARPTSHEPALFDHVRAALEGWQLDEPVVALALSASFTVPAGGEQGDLLTPRWADPAALEAAFDRIRGREGADAVAVPARRDAHLPGDAGAWETAADVPPGPGAPRHDPAPRAALRLLSAPEPVRVRLGRAGLAAFRHGDTWHDVTGWSGPERLAPRWWLHGASAHPRDYYTTRARDGTLWLLFRAADARAWFLEGWWD